MGIIDLRDQNARLCARIHLRFGSGRYLDGHCAVSDFIDPNHENSGLSAFLTLLVKAGDASKRRIRLLADAINLAQETLGTPDHAFTFIVRALDGLGNDLKLTRSDLSRELPPATSAKVKGALSEASEAIRRLATPKASSCCAKAKTR